MRQPVLVPQPLAAAVAVAAGWFLLPRTRHRAARQGADPLGLLLLAAAATGIWPLLAGALCAYLVLFGPLVLLPQVLTAHGGSVAHAGLLLTALPAGFGLAAVAGEKVCPARWPDRRRCLAGGLLASGCAAALAIPAPDMVMASWLALLGAGLGTYIPANNTAIMTAIPPGQAAAAGGMVNMARGLGTALGAAVVTLALHRAARLGHAPAGPAAAMAALAMCALASARAAPASGGAARSAGAQADGLAGGIARLRRALRRGARVASPGNPLAVAQLKLLSVVAEHPGPECAPPLYGTRSPGTPAVPAMSSRTPSESVRLAAVVLHPVVGPAVPESAVI